MDVFLFDYVHIKSYQQVVNGNENGNYKNKSLIISWLQGFLWNRRESNPGPNREAKSFLHA